MDAVRKALANVEKSDSSAAAKARAIFDALTSDDIAEIRKGLFAGLGALPWEVVKATTAGW